VIQFSVKYPFPDGKRGEASRDQMRLKRSTLFIVGTIVASFCLYIALAAGLIGVPGVPPSVFWDRTLPTLCVLAAISADIVLAWFWRRTSGKNFGLAFAYISLAIFVGAVLISVAVMRGNWLEIMKELYLRI
jgi:hypothetical protein